MRPLRYAFLVAAVVASGIYLFVYLFRWEWHRAVVAGVIFVAAEVALAAAAILDRLRSIEARLASRPGSAQPGAEVAAEALGRLRETAPGPRTSFDWLSREDTGMSVFVPLLLGAGVVLSGAAWVVERVARVTAKPVLERGLALRLAPLGLPAGTLAGTASPPAPFRRRSVVPHLVAVAAAVAVATVGIDALADASQNRPDTVLEGTTSSVIVAVDPGSARSPVTSTKALWGACTTQLGGGFKVVGMTELEAGQVQVLVTPRIGTYAERRLRGCVGDATTDRIRASVRSVTTL
ncbi:MAG TPA: hypothetical protein VHM89_04495 [Acidimicrobiales bacterium]|nr:hypothetical protein [Acidimicrobiales bacterium]